MRRFWFGEPGGDWGGFALRFAASGAYLALSLGAARVLGSGVLSTLEAGVLIAAIIAPALAATVVFERLQKRRDEFERLQQVRAAFSAGLFTVGVAFGVAARQALDVAGGAPRLDAQLDVQLAMPAVGVLAWLIAARWQRLRFS